MKRTLICGVLVALIATRATGQAAADSAGIRATAHDYIDGWYEGDGARMERALHPHLAKRLVYQDQQGRSRLVDITALELVQSTRSGVGKIPPAERRDSVTILDLFGNAAARADRRHDLGGFPRADQVERALGDRERGVGEPAPRSLNIAVAGSSGHRSGYHSMRVQTGARAYYGTVRLPRGPPSAQDRTTPPRRAAEPRAAGRTRQGPRRQIHALPQSAT